MNSRFTWWFAFVLVLTLGAWFRVTGLQTRPMHTDEAVHAVKFGQLLDDGFYKYDPYEYHGPTLNYWSLIPAWITGTKDIYAVNDGLLRLVPAFFGIAVIALIWVLPKDKVSPVAVFTGAILTAISPAMVYYSRYYIQEMLLVFFVFALIVFAYRYFLTAKVLWIILAAIAAGLAFATKETSVISFGALFLTAIIVKAASETGLKPANISKRHMRHMIYAVLAAAGVSILFYSSFFTNPAGILDSIRTYTIYLERAGTQNRHAHPWSYYLNLLLYWNRGSGPIWTEAFILILGFSGIFLAWFKPNRQSKDFWRFLGTYSLIIVIIYSALPYKTPWCMLNFLQPMALMAGYALAWCFSKFGTRLKPFFFTFVVAGTLHLGYLSYMNNFEYATDPHNPYTYAQPTDDVFRINQKVREIINSADRSLTVQVTFAKHEYWPLPWYFRDMDKIGWNGSPPANIAHADLIIADIRQEFEIAKFLYEKQPPGQRDLYLPLFESLPQLRPGMPVQIYIKADLWSSIVN